MVTDDDEVFLDDEEWDDEPVAAEIITGRARAPRKKRMRMGQTVARLGGTAKAAKTDDAVQAATRRAHADAARRLLKGGGNKGEQKGHGVARQAKP